MLNGINKVFLFITAAFSAALAMGAGVQVSEVQARQRYPWNGKVDIDFVLASDDANADFKVTFECVDPIGNTNIVLRTLWHDGKNGTADGFTVKRGNHRVTWDADADAPNQKYRNLVFSVIANDVNSNNPNIGNSEYLIIDVSNGPDALLYPVKTLTGVPNGGWTDEHKTTKIVLRKCPKGADPLGRYTLTKDFYMGVFEITQKQWELVMGNIPVMPDSGAIYPGMPPQEFAAVYPSDPEYQSYSEYSIYPVNYVSYKVIRGSNLGSQWPTSSGVDSSSFIGKLRAKTGMSALDLPTEAQWEYACRAGTRTTYNTGNDEDALKAAGWYIGNIVWGMVSDYRQEVGQKNPNDWGLYDMHGNVWEWCLDSIMDNQNGEFPKLSGTDPKGDQPSDNRTRRGGGYMSSATDCASSFREDSPEFRLYPDLGFRLSGTIP